MKFHWEDWVFEILLLILLIIFSIYCSIQNESLENIKVLWIVGGVLYLLSLGGSGSNGRDM